MTAGPYVVVITRVGIGVFDPEWFEARLALFATTSLPSIAADEAVAEWILLVDEDLPDEIFAHLRAALDLYPSVRDRATFLFVESVASVNRAVVNHLRATRARDERIVFHFLDDDDMLAPGFFEPALDLYASTPDDEFHVVTQPDGYAVDAPALEFGELDYPYNVANTTFIATPAMVPVVLAVPHPTWGDWGRARGWTVTELPGRRSWAYLYHPQGDGSYVDRVAKLRADGPLRPIDELAALGFAVDADGFREWRHIQAGVPATLGLTWRRSQGDAWRLADLAREAAATKRRMVAYMSDVFSPGSRFCYVLYPSHSASRPAGRIAFHGAATPGSRVELWVSGRGEAIRMGEATANAETGEWGIAANFSAATWNISIRHFIGEEIDQTIEYPLHVSAE